MGNDLLAHFEREIRKFHIKLIKGICRDVFNKPELSMEMLSKYMKKHENSNLNETIRPKRINCDPYRYYTEYNSDDEENCNSIYDYDDLDSYDLSRNENENENETNRCHFMVHYNRKIRQCRQKVVGISDYCGLHSNQIVYPFGAIDKETNKIIHPNHYIDESSDEDNS